MSIRNLPTAIYSAKAASILSAYLRKNHYDCEVTREPSGALRVEGRNTYDINELLHQMFRLTWQSEIVNTVRTRAQDTRTYRMNGQDFPMRDISLFCSIELKKYPEKSLRAWFGDEAYDEMVGRPSNPMIQAQRQVYLQQLEELTKDKLHASCDINGDFSARIIKLRLQCTEAIEASDAAFDAKIKAVKDALANLEK